MMEGEKDDLWDWGDGLADKGTCCRAVKLDGLSSILGNRWKNRVGAIDCPCCVYVHA